MLGEPRVVGYGQTISRFESRRAVALLAYLILNPNSRHPREVLIDRIWPEATLEAGRNRLKQTLASLRRQLEPPWLEPGSVLDSDRALIGIRPGSMVSDVQEFLEAARLGNSSRARELIRGDLLPGFYDEWLEDHRLEVDALRFDLELEKVAPERPLEVPAAMKRLPPPITSFLGRHFEIDAILSAFEAGRWVTVTGFGGVGKTRLTQQVARQWPGSVWFVPLADASTATDILNGCLRAMNIEAGAGEARRALKEALGEGALLVLDNLEQIAAAAGPVISDLLESAPAVFVLASSRVPIRGEGEAEIALGPLPVPGADSDLSGLVENPSVALFVDRARKVRADFQVTLRNAAAVRDVCRLMDGMPLAIELCAAWAHAVSPSQMLVSLSKSPDLLVARRRDALDRHQSLTHVFESSFALLPEVARDLLGRLSVFRGGWDLESAEAVCGSDDLLGGLTALIEMSFVRPVYDSDPPRYAFLESLRQFADSTLEDSERQVVRERFMAHFANLATKSACIQRIESRGIARQSDWIAFLNADWTNFRTAAEMMIAAGRLIDAARFLADTEWFWSIYQTDSAMARIAGSLSEQLEPSEAQILMRMLALSHLKANLAEDEIGAEYDRLYEDATCFGASRLQGECRLRHAKLLLARQQMEKVEKLASVAYSHFKIADDGLAEGQALHILANAAIQRGDRERTASLRQEAEAKFVAAGSQIHQAALIYTQARECYMEKRFEDALPFLYRCRDLGRGLQNFRYMGRTANLFGCIFRNLGEERLGRVYFYLAIAANSRAHELRGAHIPLWNMFLSLQLAGRWEAAVPQMGLSLQIWDELYKVAQDQEDQEHVDLFCKVAREDLGAARFAELEQMGRSMTLSRATEIARLGVLEELAENREEARTFFGETFPELVL